MNTCHVINCAYFKLFTGDVFLHASSAVSMEDEIKCKILLKFPWRFNPKHDRLMFVIKLIGSSWSTETKWISCNMKGGSRRFEFEFSFRPPSDIWRPSMSFQVAKVKQVNYYKYVVETSIGQKIIRRIIFYRRKVTEIKLEDEWKIDFHRKFIVKFCAQRVNELKNY